MKKNCVLLCLVILVLISIFLGCSSSKNPTDSTNTDPESGSDGEYDVFIDEFHYNNITYSGWFKPFANLLNENGYYARSSTDIFTTKILEGRVDVLVITNALAWENRADWSLPTPSAFTDSEIEAVRKWVETGGSLLLIADHMPFPGAAAKLAAAFGINFNNGFAIDTEVVSIPKKCNRGGTFHIFRQSDGSLTNHIINSGTSMENQIDSVATFTGQAFQGDAETQPLFIFGSSAISIMPEESWIWINQNDTTIISVDGWYQGAVKDYGSGRAAFFGETEMFSETTCGILNNPTGMNAPAGSQNRQFILNLFLWLTNRLDNN